METTEKPQRRVSLNVTDLSFPVLYGTITKYKSSAFWYDKQEVPLLLPLLVGISAPN